MSHDDAMQYYDQQVVNGANYGGILQATFLLFCLYEPDGALVALSFF